MKRNEYESSFFYSHVDPFLFKMSSVGDDSRLFVEVGSNKLPDASSRFHGLVLRYLTTCKYVTSRRYACITDYWFKLSATHNHFCRVSVADRNLTMNCISSALVASSPVPLNMQNTFGVLLVGAIVSVGFVERLLCQYAQNLRE